MFFDTCNKLGLIVNPNPPILVDGTQVSNYFFKGCTKEFWKFSDPCFTGCLPPFPEIWIEFRAPDKVISSVEGINNWYGPDEWACWAKISTPEMVGIQPKANRDVDDLIIAGQYQRFGKEVKKGKAVIMVGLKNGKIIPIAEKMHVGLLMDEKTLKNSSEAEKREILETMSTQLQPALLAFSLLNLNDISLAKQDVDNRYRLSYPQKGIDYLITDGHARIH